MLPQTHLRTRFTVLLTEAAAFPDPLIGAPSRCRSGFQPIPRAGARPTHGAMAEPSRIERLTFRPLGLSKPFEEPTSVGSFWRKRKESNPHPFWGATVFRTVARPFRRTPPNWYSRSDSNGHFPTSKDGDSCQLVYGSKLVRAMGLEPILCAF